MLAWRATDSGYRYLHVTADRHRAPIRGGITAVLACDQHREFWTALGLDQLDTGNHRGLSVEAHVVGLGSHARGLHTNPNQHRAQTRHASWTACAWCWRTTCAQRNPSTALLHGPLATRPIVVAPGRIR